MKIDDVPYRTIWPSDDGAAVRIIDQTRLPHEFETVDLTSAEDCHRAIADMLVRGAPLIGATAAYGVALAMRSDSSDDHLEAVCTYLAGARPTAINLRWALDEMRRALTAVDGAERAEAAFAGRPKLLKRMSKPVAGLARTAWHLLRRLPHERVVGL